MKRELQHWLGGEDPADNLELLEPSMTIGEGARSTGLSESALRKYEAAGLILYHRSGGNVRVLSQEDILRVKMIQGLIKEQGLNLEGIRRLWSLLPCWECKACDDTKRATCATLDGSNKPCWMLKREENRDNTEACRHCEVYRLSARCTEHLKVIVHTASRPGIRLEGKAVPAA